MLEVAGLILACLDFFKWTDPVELGLERAFKWASDGLATLVFIATTGAIRENGHVTAISIPFLVFFVLCLTGGFAFSWNVASGIFGTIFFGIIFTGMIYLAIYFFIRAIVFAMLLVMFLLEVMNRAKSGMIGSIGLLIAILAFAERMTKD